MQLGKPEAGVVVRSRLSASCVVSLKENPQNNDKANHAGESTNHDRLGLKTGQREGHDGQQCRWNQVDGAFL